MADKYTPERATSGKERLRTWWKKVEKFRAKTAAIRYAGYS